MYSEKQRTWLSFLLATVLLVGFLWVLGPRQIGDNLRGTYLPIFAVGLLSALGGLVAWSETQRHLLAASGIYLSPWRGFIVYCIGMFAKQVLPMGHAAGPALATYAVGTEVDRSYAENLAPISVAEFQMLGASICLAAVGLGYTLVTVPATGVVRTLGVATVIVIASLGALALVVWYRRRVIERSLLWIAWVLRMTVGRISPRIQERISPKSVSAGSNRYYLMIRTVADDRRRIVVSFVWGIGGWIAFTIPLVTSAAALGVNLPVASALFLAPVVGIAGLVPLPGGLGGAEIGLTGLLVTVSGFPAPLAAGITLLYRVCTFWFVVLVCGAISAHKRVLPSEAIQHVRQ